MSQQNTGFGAQQSLSERNTIISSRVFRRSAPLNSQEVMDFSTGSVYFAASTVLNVV